MAQPVWVLSVDLQTKTATFQTGLADAAKSARGAFSDIKGGAGEMGSRTSYSMMEARHSVMMLGEEFGLHLPRALSMFVASIGPIGPALEAAFPFLAIATMAGILIEHLVKMHEAGEKLTDDQVNFGTAVDNAFGELDKKIIQAQIKSDELRNDHLGALQLQLQLIDKQSLAELVHSFEEVDKAAAKVMADLQGHWYTFGIGSDGASNALKQFKGEYDNLLAQGKDEEASGLLKGTLDQARKVQEALRTYRENSGGLLSGPKDGADTGAALRAYQVLHAANLSGTEKELEAQDALVNALQSQVGLEGQINKLKDIDKGNVKTQSGNEEAARRSAAARQSAQNMLQMGEQSIAADKATANALLTQHRASLEQRLESDLEFAGRERDIKEAANQAEIAALDKSGKDYTAQLKTLQDKALSITNEYDAKVAELKASASTAMYNRDIQLLEQAERTKIEATQRGSAARLAAIDAAIREEEAHNLQDSSAYRELLNQRAQAAAAEADEEARSRSEAAREDADNTVRMGQLALEAERQRVALEDSIRGTTIEQRIAEDTYFANEEYAIRMAAMEKEAAGLDKGGKDYQNKLRQLQDKERQLTQQHENEITAIRERAEQERNQRSIAALSQLEDATARGLTQSIVGHQTWSRMLINLTDQVASAALESRIRELMALDFGKEKEAAAAARKFFLAGAKLPFPVNLVAAPVLAAGAFAAVMAFEGGTDRVPGVGRGDVVPSMLTPGEGVVPGGVMDGLRTMAHNGGFEQGPRNHVNMHVHMHASALDADGMDKVLEKHSDKLQRHFENTLRKMNR